MEPAADLKDVYLRSFEAYAQGDLAAFERGISQEQGVMMIGTDPNEWIRGYDQIIEMFGSMLAAQQQAGLVIEPGDVEAYREGSVGWVTDRPTFRTKDGRAVTCRATTIFRQEDGEWKIVNAHYSIGVPNEEVDAFQSSGG